MFRFVVSERDPGVANWLECTGHRRGYVQLRWQRLSRDLPARGRATGRGGQARRARASGCRSISKRETTSQEYTERIAARQAAVARRMLG